jgi:hypothetical protein
MKETSRVELTTANKRFEIIGPMINFSNFKSIKGEVELDACEASFTKVLLEQKG